MYYSRLTTTFKIKSKSKTETLGIKSNIENPEIRAHFPNTC